MYERGHHQFPFWIYEIFCCPFINTVNLEWNFSLKKMIWNHHFNGLDSNWNVWFLLNNDDPCWLPYSILTKIVYIVAGNVKYKTDFLILCANWKPNKHRFSVRNHSSVHLSRYHKTQTTLWFKNIIKQNPSFVTMISAHALRDKWPPRDFKGAWSRGFRRFLVKTVLKLSVANFIHAQHCVWTFKGTY